ncbi:hypothetical protein E8E14_008991 [Neopestalotiopsis sp. 37M]|nr:hypothetical protein E8E14_008991 [Neopestalotiopsis sp. 37M]
MSSHSLDRFRGRQRGNQRVNSLRQRFEESDASASSSTSEDTTSSPQRTVFSGDERIPLRERLALIKTRVAAASSSSASPLGSSDASRPTTPQQHKTLDCPPAPRKPRSSGKIRERVSAERLHASSCDHEDIMLDRRANAIGDCDDWFVNTEKALPSLPLAWDEVSVPFSDVGDDNEDSVGPEMKRHLNTFWQGDGDGDHGKREMEEVRLKGAYLNGEIDGKLADLKPGMISLIEDNRKKIDDEGEKGAPSANEMMSSLYGAIDQELPRWEPDELEQQACERDLARILRAKK